MNDLTYYLLCGVCVAAVLLGINLMSKVKSSVLGNGLSAAAMVLAIGRGEAVARDRRSAANAVTAPVSNDAGMMVMCDDVLNIPLAI